MLKESDILEGIDFKGRLRFSINYLEIWYNEEFQKIPEFNSGIQSLGDPITLKYVLFDTGNKEGNCNLTYHYFQKFNKKFPQIKFNPKEGETKRSKEREVFCFYNKVEFESYIGFRYFEDNDYSSEQISDKIENDFPPEWINRINIGIDSILQFISIIYPLHLKNRTGKFLCL